MYRGSRYDSLYGKYIFVDYCSGIFRLLYRKGGSSQVAKAFKGDDSAYSSFGVDILLIISHHKLPAHWNLAPHLLRDIINVQHEKPLFLFFHSYFPFFSFFF